MDFGWSKEQELYRQHVRMLLADEPVRAGIAALDAQGPEPDVRPLYRQLGQCGLLAPNWPVEYGGGGRGLLDAAIVAEELVRAGVPDTLHVNTIQIVGLFILMAGTPEQKAAYLPRLARGELFASVLYTEPHCGSDLGALATTARRDRDGSWRISGVKVFSMKSHLTDIGLCAARTGDPDSRYEGISLFLVDLHAPGVRRTLIASIADEQFHRLELDNVRVGAGDLVGAENKGWPLLTESLVVERTGLDYSLKSERWLAAACELLAIGNAGTEVGGGEVGGAGFDSAGFDSAGFDSAEVGDAVLEEIGRHGAAVAASRLLTWQVLAGLTENRPNDAAAAVAKLYNSELAQRIAVWSAARLPGSTTRRLPARPAALLEAAYREAPGVTLAGGTSDVMLQIIAAVALDGLAEEAPW